MSDKKTTKRKQHGRISDATKRIRAMSHMPGDPCLCKRFKCFDIIKEKERDELLKQFNLMGGYNKQMEHLTGLISVLPIKQRRPRMNEEESISLKQFSYEYKVRVFTDGKINEVTVCQKAFISLHGITNQTINTIKKSLNTTGKAPVDNRGKHKNRKHAKSQETTDKVHEHLSSLKGRKSHYSLKKSSKVYLSEELNINKLYKMYSELYPNNPVSYEFYRNVFNTEYNFGFGYPRKDSCSKCDEFKARKENLGMGNTDQERDELSNLSTQHLLHLKKAEVFYARKKCAKQKAKSDPSFEAICVDFMKNLPCPNLSTNDVYYRRQLSFYLFNVHVLSNHEVIFYAYDETIAKKGANDVCSMLHHFITTFLKPEVKHLEIFLDSCPGQNKNFTVFRFLHYVCTHMERLQTVKLTFPTRGHSYMEPDKDMGIINVKNYSIEMPKDWVAHIASSRSNPSPFKVFCCDQSLFKKWELFLSGLGYKKKSGFPTRPITEIKFASCHPRTIYLRTTYNGVWNSFIIKDNRGKRSQISTAFPENAYSDFLNVSNEKYNDLQVLKRFCRDETQTFLTNLKH
jgi:hypothetical protein